MSREKNYLKPVVKMRDMDDEMLRNIEGWARETLEETKVKYKDEMVNLII